MTIDNAPSGIPLWAFIVGATTLVVGALAAVWFAVPAPDTSHRLVSPSGKTVLELAELCGEARCNRVAILDVTQPDGTRVRTGCPLDLPGNLPLFADIVATWSADETSVAIAAGGPEELVFSRSQCTLAE